MEKVKSGVHRPPYPVPPTSPRPTRARGAVREVVGTAHFVDKPGQLRLKWGAPLAPIDSSSAPVC